MTPRERTVVRAIIRALRNGRDATDMMAYASSYSIPPAAFRVRGEGEAMLLEALLKEGEQG